MRLRRAVARSVRGCLLACVLAGLFAVATPIALSLPPVRRLLVTKINLALAPIFVGRVVVDRIGNVGATSIGGIDAHVDGADGALVLRVEGARARVSTWALVRSAFGGALVVDVPELSVERADAAADTDGTGALRIARAFALRAAPAGGPGRATRVTLPRVHVAHAAVHVRLAGVPALEVEVTGAGASVAAAAGELTTFAIDVGRTALAVRGIPGELDARGEVEVHVTHPSPDVQVRAQVRWNGTVGMLREQAELDDQDGHIDGTLDVESATPEEMRSLWPACPLSATTRAHVEVHGVLPRLDVVAHASMGAGVLDVAGPVTIGPDVQGALHVSVRGIDAHACAPSAVPAELASDLAASGEVSIAAKRGGAFDATAWVAFEGGTLGATRLPPATLAIELAQPAAGALSGRAEISVSQPGAQTVVTAHLKSSGGSSGGSPVVTFEGETNVTRLEDADAGWGAGWDPKRRGGAGTRLSGAGIARATGTIDVGAGTVDARLSATVGHLGARGVSLDHGHLGAQARGPIRAPVMDVQIDGEGLAAPAMHLSAVHAQGRVTVDQGATARDVELEVAGDGEPARARAALIRLAGDGVRVQDAVVEGLGGPLTATLFASSTRVEVRARGDRIDLARVATMATLPVKRGTLSLDVDASVNANANAPAAHGRATVEVQHVELPGIDDASARLEAAFDGRRVSGNATASLGDFGTFEARSSSAQLGNGPLFSSLPWKRVWGSLRLGAHVDLARLAARLPGARAAFDGLRGTLDAQGEIALDSAGDATPEVEITAHTTGLALTRPWHLEGIDPTVHATVDGATGDTTLELQVRDAGGVLGALDAHSATVPYGALFSADDPFDALASTSFDAKLVVPPRSLDAVSPVFHAGAIGGQAEGTLSWRGSVRSPAIDLVAEMKGARPFPSVLTRRMDWSLAAHYDGARADATLRASSHGRQVIDASAQVLARAADLVAGMRGAAVPWTASGRARLDKLPLQSFAVLDDGQVRGNVTGDATLDGLHADARARLALTTDDLQVGELAGRSSSLEVTVDGHALDATARIDHGDGVAEGHARLGTRWGAATAPSFDASQPAEASLTARQFRMALLLPFVSRWVSDLDGRLDADAGVTLAAGDEVGATAKLRGTIGLTDGSFELMSFGGEFHDVSGNVTFSPDGIARLENAVARGITGTVQAAATARLEGLSVASARATVAIPGRDPLPLVFDGVQLGMLDGAFDVALSRVGDRAAHDAAHEARLDVAVDVPTAHVQLPMGRSSADVQALGDVQGVRVGVRGGASGGATGGVSGGADGFVEVPLDGSRDGSVGGGAPRTPIQIAVKLGDVRVNRGTDLDVRLQGKPTISIADGSTRVSGQIRMARGTIDVQGKRFTLDRGTVAFVGDDPGNPQIVLTASWDAPDGTHVYADFVGPLKTGKVTLRSEPSRTQSEILALILFGTDDQTSPSGTATAEVSPMAAAAGGAAAQPINRTLDGLGLGGGISTKIDTSQTNPRPEVAVQIARDISVQIAWVLGTPPPGSSDTTLVTLNWRFLRKWSLETTVGDAGTSIFDVVWQHRY